MPQQHDGTREKGRALTPMGIKSSLSGSALDSVSLPEPGVPVAAIRPATHQHVKRPQAIRQPFGHVPTLQAAALNTASHPVEASRAAPEAAGVSGRTAAVADIEVGMDSALSTSAQGQLQHPTGHSKPAEEPYEPGGLASGLATAMVPGWLEQVAAIAAAAASAASAAIQAQQQPQQQALLQQQAPASREHMQEPRQHGSAPGGQQWHLGQEVRRVGDKEAEAMVDYGASSQTADAELSDVQSTSHKAGNTAQLTAAAAMGPREGPPLADAGLSGGSQAVAICSIPVPASGSDQRVRQGDASNSDQPAGLHPGSAAPSLAEHLILQTPAPSLMPPFTMSVPSSELHADHSSKMPEPEPPGTMGVAQAGSRPGSMQWPTHTFQVSARSHASCSPPLAARLATRDRLSMLAPPPWQAGIDATCARWQALEYPPILRLPALLPPSLLTPQALQPQPHNWSSLLPSPGQDPAKGMSCQCRHWVLVFLGADLQCSFAQDAMKCKLGRTCSLHMPRWHASTVGRRAGIHRACQGHGHASTQHGGPTSIKVRNLRVELSVLCAESGCDVRFLTDSAFSLQVPRCLEHH